MKTTKNNDISIFFDELSSNWDKIASEVDAITCQWLRAYLGDLSGQTVADIGCGTGILTQELLKSTVYQIYAVDLSKNMLALAQEKNPSPRVTFLQQDITSTPLEKTVDKIIIFNALPHMLNVEGLLTQLCASLRPQGDVYILHSMGRSKLNALHQDSAPSTISRPLSDLSQEFQPFSCYFSLVDSKDTDEMFFMHMKFHPR